MAGLIIKISGIYMRKRKVNKKHTEEIERVRQTADKRLYSFKKAIHFLNAEVLKLGTAM